MNALILCAVILCSTLVFTYAQQEPADENMDSMDKRYSKFAFAKRFDALGYNSFAKRSADLDGVDEQLTEPEKRARYAAFAKRSRYGFAFAKRARFAFA